MKIERITISIILLIFTMGCVNHTNKYETSNTLKPSTNPTAKTENSISSASSNKVEIGFVFKTFNKTEKPDMEVPYTTISLSVNGKITEIDTVMGNASEIKEFDKYGM